MVIEAVEDLENMSDVRELASLHALANEGPCICWDGVHDKGFITPSPLLPTVSEPLRAGIEIEPGASALANFSAETRPRILLRACHHLGPHGIACDRAGTGPHVPVRLDRAGEK